MHKRVALTLVLLLAAAGVAVAASTNAQSAQNRATASKMLVGFYDDEQVFGRTDYAFTQLKSLKAGIVRITLDWAIVAKKRPTAPADPTDAAYEWDAYDKVIQAGCQEQGSRPDRDLRDAPVGRCRQEPAAAQRHRPPPVRLRGREALQRHVRGR